MCILKFMREDILIDKKRKCCPMRTAAPMAKIAHKFHQMPVVDPHARAWKRGDARRMRNASSGLVKRTMSSIGISITADSQSLMP